MIAAVDPGRDKCGLAVVENSGEIIAQEVLGRQELARRVVTITKKYNLELVVLGNGTCSEEIKKVITENDLLVEVVNERNSTLEARKLYWEHNPPQGWRKLIPTALQTPQIAVDGYAAVILAQRYLNNYLT